MIFLLLFLFVLFLFLFLFLVVVIFYRRHLRLSIDNICTLVVRRGRVVVIIVVVVAHMLRGKLSAACKFTQVVHLLV